MPDTKVFQGVEPFQSASELRNEHASLLETLDRVLGQDTSEENESASLVQLVPQIQQFLSRGVATGLYLEEIKERTACQVLLDYWVSSLSRAGIQVSGIRLAQFDEKRLPILKEEDCPYVGLEAFRDKTNFFGREGGTRKLLEQVLDSPLVVVLGASGSGKSSIVMGGVLPALEEKGATPELIIVPPFVPGNTVLDNLVNAVRQVHQDASGGVAKAVALLRKDPMRLSVMVGGEHALPTLITIDQFEEVFTLSASGDCEALVANLAKFLEAGRGHRVILTVREEFKSQIRRLRVLSPYLEVEEAWYSMRPMTGGELKAAIEKPAVAMNLQFQEGIVDDLVNKVLDQDTALPLLQFTLKSLWKKRKRNRITWDVYNEVGEPLKALEEWANKIYARELDDQDEIKRILLELVRVDEALEAYRQPVPKSRLLQPGKANTERVLKLLEDNDFVRIKRGASDSDTVVEVKHESLIRNWPTYVNWIKEKRDKRLPLTLAAQRWEESGKRPQGLFTEYQLEQVKSQPDLSELEKKFIAASTKAINRMQKQKQADLRREGEQLEKLRMTRRLAWGLGTLAVLLILGIVTYKYLFVREYANYYHEIVKVHGIPVGVGKKLEPHQYKARPCSLKIIKRGRWGDDKGDVVRMEAVNGRDKLTLDHNIKTYFGERLGECWWEYIRDPQGRLAYEKAYDKSGKLVWVFVYSPPPGRTQTQSRLQYIRDCFKRIINERRYKELGKVVIALIHKPFAEDNTVIRDAMYLREKPISLKVKKAEIEEGRHKSSVEAKQGKITKDASMEKKDGTSDIATTIPFIFSEVRVASIVYSKEGYDKKILYFDQNYNPLAVLDKAYGREYEYDQMGRVTKLISLAGDGKTWMIDAYGNAALEKNYDNSKNEIEYIARDDHQLVTKVKDGWAKVIQKFDNNWNLTEEAYYGIKGKEEPILNKDGYHKEKEKYDDNGNRTEWAYFGIKDGERVLHKDRYHKETGKYDDRGNLIERAYFGIKEEPILNKDHYHKVTMKYDDRGNLIDLVYFGTPINKTENPILYQGYHKVTMKYDAKGNRTEWAYFGTPINKTENPILYQGYHKEKEKYDDNGNRTEWAYFGIKEEPILNKDHYHKVTMKYDDRGNLIDLAYFGTPIDGAENPILYQGYHKVTMKYDAKGNRIELAIFGLKKGELIARMSMKYDVSGNLTEKAYFGPDNRPIKVSGCARLRYKYDATGRLTKKRCFDENNFLIP